MSTSTAPPTLSDVPQRRRRVRPRIVLIGLLTIGVLLVAALLLRGSAGSEEPLDPGNAGNGGSRAIAEVLRAQGVEVDPINDADQVKAPADGAATTLVITRGDLLSVKQWEALAPSLRGYARVVLIDPGTDALTGLKLPLEERSSAFGDALTAQCTIAEARGLTLNANSQRYAQTSGDASTQVCFRPDSSFSAGGDEAGALAKVAATDARPETFVIGSLDTIANGRILEADAAAVGLRSLGAHPRLVWWNVTASDIDHTTAPPARFPSWVTPAWVLALATLAVLMFVRGRRLGRVVTEPLPVVVRADETTRARGQLYRRAGDVARSGAVLRVGTRQRLASYLLTGPDPEALISAVHAATGRDIGEIRHLLMGAPPTTESEMTTLAQHLRTLEKEVRPR